MRKFLILAIIHILAGYFTMAGFPAQAKEKRESYLPDTSLTYVYKHKDGTTETFTFDQMHEGWQEWTVTDSKGTRRIAFMENEEFLMHAPPESSAIMDLQFPVKTGQFWDRNTGQENDISSITGVNMPIKTPAGLFKKAVEVTEKGGYKKYYAPNIGLIQTTHNDQVIYQLTQLK
ncbi:hypothetical protein WQ57_23800 [Mesobacillus campisalis]|uniref:Uncharacterized protein n=1 Tax=Mesobacillus campisalis TaxID=1408103 RepID=A0A0M2SFY4_9BACI|nr:hypothetical protein [Mesobacillus campisalis]KKK33639.1 hypothetical protein WQ57_23800 [Mesobacillus campisalis]